MRVARQTEIAPISSQRYGLPALFEELALEGISEAQVMQCAGLAGRGPNLGFHERTALFRAARTLSARPESALLAGRRQNIGYYGAYGYALATSATMRDALRTGREFLHLSGTVLLISFRVEGGQGVWRSHQPESLGAVLPFVAEYWRSSLTTIFSQLLGRPFPSLRMSFPYPAPAHAGLYPEIFGCPVSFNSDVMEWRFDAAIADEPLCLADPIVAELCAQYAEQFVEHSGASSGFQRELLRVCLDSASFPKIDAPSVAAAMNLSVRTFYRRLGDEGISFQRLLDGLLRSLALEYLENTELPVEEIASRCGYRDPSNFRKAFKRWTGRTPSVCRAQAAASGAVPHSETAR